jgi:tetratricopeptide (TPR) repeat protein
VIKLKPGWVKGHARAAAAYMGLELYSEAKEAYEKAVKLEPDDQVRRLWEGACWEWLSLVRGSRVRWLGSWRRRPERQSSSAV